MRDVSFLSDGRLLDGRLFDHPGGGTDRRGVLFVHGQGSNQQGYENRAKSTAHNLRAVCMTFDLSGHGRDASSFNRYSIKDHLDDVIAAYDFLSSHGDLSRSRFGVCGASYGAYLAALLTAHRPIKSLILRAPSLSEDMDLAPGRWQANEPSADFDSIAVLRRYEGEVLVVESEKDEVVPKSNIAAYLASGPRTQHGVLPEATHTLTNPVWDRIFIDMIISWFDRL